MNSKDVINYLRSVELRVNSSKKIQGNMLKESFTRQEAEELTTIGVIMTTLSNNVDVVESGLGYLVEKGYINE